jgi:hypothetical protein
MVTACLVLVGNEILSKSITRGRKDMYKKILVAGTVIALMVSAPAWAIQELNISWAQHFPAPGAVNRDRGDDLTALLLDGNVGTGSAMTASFTTNIHGEQCVGFDLSGLAVVNRLRMYKWPEYGGCDIWVYYTTDTDSDLGQRTWQPVTGLTNGYEGTELITLHSTYGSISGNEIFAELHTGWFSVTFDPVYATGIAIGFLMNEYIGATNNHVWIYEAEIYDETTSWASVPAPANGALGVFVDTDLHWTHGFGIDSQAVYFGTDEESLPLLATGDGALDSIANAALNSGEPLPPNTTWFWRVDGVDNDAAGGPQSYTGDLWSFTTEPPIINPPGTDVTSGRLCLWLDAADSATVTLDAGNRVTRWADKSNYGNDAVATTPPLLLADAINSLDVVRFGEGGVTDEMLTTEQESPFFGEDFAVTVLAVSRLHSPVLNFSSLLSQAPGQTGGMAFTISEYIGGAAGTDYWAPGGIAGTVRLPLATANLTTWVIPHWGNHQTNGRIYYDRLEQEVVSYGAPVPALNAGAFRIGNWNPNSNDMQFPGDVGELVVYTGALSDEDRQAVEVYLGRKWGVLSEHHPALPVPADGAFGVATETDLTWLPGWDLDGQTVYFGDDPAEMVVVISGDVNLARTPNEALHGSTSLEGSQTYYWRVDGAKGIEQFEGPLWSFTTCPTLSWCIGGDLNADCFVGLHDLGLFAQQWLSEPGLGSGSADFDSSGGVDTPDFAVLSDNWQNVGWPLVISEFMASNQQTHLDGFGDYPDWIEIHNPSWATIDLTGWYLTDDENDLTKWQLPAVSLAAQQFLVFFASGQDGIDPAGNWHTNFQLDKNGEYLALVTPDGSTTSHAYASQYPEQQEDVSYGLDATVLREQPRYYDLPTPGTFNEPGYAAPPPEKPQFSRDGGLFTDNFTLELTTSTPGALIRYTLNGSVPTQNSTVYVGPLTISETTEVRARAFATDALPSKIASQAYLHVDNDCAAFSSNLPIVVVDSFGFNVNIESAASMKYPFRRSYAVFIDTNPDTGRSTFGSTPNFAGRTGIKVRGQSSAGWEKKSYSFETWDEYNSDTDVSLLGLPAESDWALYGPYSDKTLIRNVLAYKWSNEMGRYAPRTQLVEVFFNMDGGPIKLRDNDTSYGADTDYVGVYVLTEKIKRSPDRVAITKLAPYDNTEPALTGGYILQHDWGGPGFWVGNGFWEYFEPEADELTETQKDYIAAYVNEFDQVLMGPDFADPVNGYANYIDPTSFIDHHLLVEMPKNGDGFRHSFFMFKDRGGKLNLGPIWDWNLSLGTYDSYSAWEPEGWYYPIIYGHVGVRWCIRLLEDPEFRLRYADRWFALRENLFATDRLLGDMDDYAAYLDEAQARNFIRWPILSTYVMFNKYVWHTYPAGIDYMKQFLQDRLIWMDGAIAAEMAPQPPVFRINGIQSNGNNYVEAGAILTMESAVGTIYYTLNGNDPHVWPGSVSDFEITPIEESATKSVLVPTGDIGTDWQGSSEPYSETGWDDGTPITPGKTGGVGYDEETTYEPYITYDVIDEMNDENESCYIRIPFNVSAQDLSSLNYMTLKIRYDDAFVAYINGQKVCQSTNAPASLSWDSGADSGRVGDDAAAIVFESFDLNSYINLLQPGDNILAIHGLNFHTNSSDFLVSPELVAGYNSSLATDISPSTIEYTGLVSLDSSCIAKARVLSGGNWSALNEAIFGIDNVEANLRISEIMYHPTDPTQAEKDATSEPNLIDEDFEFIELKNIGTEAYNLNLVHFTDGIDFTFANYTLAAGDYTVLVKNQAAFAARYNTSGINIIPGSYTGSLDNGGEEIVMRDAIGTEIHDFNYRDSWFVVTDGCGYSLNKLDPDTSSTAAPDSWDTQSGWRPSSTLNGTPGVEDTGYTLQPEDVVISEVITHTDDLVFGDWIEIWNRSGSLVYIGGWFLSDNENDLTKYEIAVGDPRATILPDSYVVFDSVNDFGNPSDLGSNVQFGLDEHGEDVYLTSGSGGVLTGEYSTEQENFGAAERDVSLGMYIKSDSSDDFVRLQTITKGSANNNDPVIGPVVISEIMYNPQNPDADAEFIELKNITGSTVLLYDAANPTNTWQIKGVSYAFPQGVTLSGGGTLLVTRGDPATFRTTYSIPGSIDIYQYSGALDNGGEKVTLIQPGEPDPITFEVPEIRIDRVNYSDGSHPEPPATIDPWPTEADGDGLSLHRKVLADYGNDVVNWQAGSTTAGQ